MSSRRSSKAESWFDEEDELEAGVSLTIGALVLSAGDGILEDVCESSSNEQKESERR